MIQQANIPQDIEMAPLVPEDTVGQQQDPLQAPLDAAQPGTSKDAQ